MKADILCVDDNSPRLMDRRKSLEDAGFAVIDASVETQAVNLLESHRVDAVCVNSSFLNTCGIDVGSSIKSVNSHFLIVLIRDNGAIPARFEGRVGLVINESDFDTRAQWLIEEKHDFQYPFFQQWFDDWKRRTTESKNSDR